MYDIRYIHQISTMPFESIPNVMLMLNPAVGDTQIVLVFPALSMKHQYERFTVMLGEEWDDTQLVDHVYSALQMQAIFALMLNYDMNNEIYIHEKNLYLANGSKWNENQCPYDLIPVADMYMAGNYYQVSLVHHMKDIPPRETKIYWVPVAYQWDEWTASDQDGYWHTMVSQILYVHDDMYNRVEETSADHVDMDVTHTDNEPLLLV